MDKSLTSHKETRLTENEKVEDLITVYMPITEAVKVFLEYNMYCQTDEMKRVFYLRKFTALTEILEGKKYV